MIRNPLVEFSTRGSPIDTCKISRKITQTMLSFDRESIKLLISINTGHCMIECMPESVDYLKLFIKFLRFEIIEVLWDLLKVMFGFFGKGLWLYQMCAIFKNLQFKNTIRKVNNALLIPSTAMWHFIDTIMKSTVLFYTSIKYNNILSWL